MSEHVCTSLLDNLAHSRTSFFRTFFRSVGMVDHPAKESDTSSRQAFTKDFVRDLLQESCAESSLQTSARETSSQSDASFPKSNERFVRVFVQK